MDVMVTKDLYTKPYKKSDDLTAERQHSECKRERERVTERYIDRGRDRETEKTEKRQRKRDR